MKYLMSVSSSLCGFKTPTAVVARNSFSKALREPPHMHPCWTEPPGRCAEVWLMRKWLVACPKRGAWYTTESLENKLRLSCECLARCPDKLNSTGRTGNLWCSLCQGSP